MQQVSHVSTIYTYLAGSRYLNISVLFGTNTPLLCYGEKTKHKSHPKCPIGHRYLQSHPAMAAQKPGVPEVDGSIRVLCTLLPSQWGGVQPCGLCTYLGEVTGTLLASLASARQATWYLHGRQQRQGECNKPPITEKLKPG